MSIHRRRVVQCAVAISLAAVVTAHGEDRVPHGLADLYRLDQLPRFKDGVSVASFSSYDPSGGNDDGFSGAHSFLRKEGDRLVIAEMTGPGAVYRIWTPTPTDDLVEFFFDGEAEPRLSVKFNDLFSGKQFPFVRPVVGAGAGGFYSYLPLTYSKSCKITIRAAKVQFYQVNYATFADAGDVKTFDPNDRDALRADIEQAGRLINVTGQDITANVVAPGKAAQAKNFADTLKPGGAMTLFESDKPGRIAAIKLSPASALAGLRRDVVLNVYYDGAKTPSFSCPVGDFFGFSFGEPAMRSLMVGTDGDQCYSYWPMPYERAIRIELASDNPHGDAIALQGEVSVADQPRTADEGSFYAVWNREKPTKQGVPFTFVNMQGKGHLVGVTLQAQGTEPGGIPEFFEGDDQTTIDGKLVINGTGSEDFFNGGWYDLPGRWDDRTPLPFSGCLDYKRYLARTGAYRLMLSDAYAFNDSILQTIEHGPTGNKIITDYTGVTYLYADRAPAAATQPATMPTADERAIDAPRRAVFSPGAAMPIYNFSRDDSTVTKRDEKIGKNGERFLAFESKAKNLKDANQFLTLVCDIAAAGKYRVKIDPIVGPQAAIVQMFENEYPLGDPQDLYAATRAVGASLVIGDVRMHAGANRITLKLIGKNEAATGQRLDLLRVICERID